MNKNLIMIVGALCVVLLIVFWVQYSVVKSLQNAASIPGVPPDGTTAAPAPAANKPALPGTPVAAPTTVTKKTTITAPVHKKH